MIGSDEPRYGGYMGPRDAALQALYWAWLRWHFDSNLNAIQELLRFMAIRGIELHQTPVSRHREKFNYYMMKAAVLSGSIDVMRRAAESVLHAERTPSGAYQMYQAITGVLKFRILNRREEELSQYQTYLATPKVHYDPLPGRALLARFVHRDYTSMDKELAKAAGRYTERLRQERNVVTKRPALVEDERGKMVIDLKNRWSAAAGIGLGLRPYLRSWRSLMART